ncbi:MAG: right-handed parallel beta-helix repeat-containing protein [Promethearchaeota archaeon]
MNIQLSRNNKLLIGFLFIILIFSTINFLNFSLTSVQIANNFYKEEKNLPHSSKYWDFDYSINETIYIKNNWSDAALENWCSGDGSWGDPYLLENISVDTFQKGIGILIEDTTEYFIIRNCTFFNSSTTGIVAGIKLSNVTNGLIEENPIYNNRYGIWMNETYNCTFSNNKIHDNDLEGIYMINCENNTFYQNKIRYNDGSGFDVNSSTLNVFDDNIVKESEEYGIILHNSDNNTVKFNTFDHCVDYGIYLDSNSDKNWILENYVGYCKAKEEDGKCIYIIDDGEDNVIKWNDCVGDCVEDPVYGELDGPEPLAISGYGVITLYITGTLMTIILIMRKCRKFEK